jgi:CRISPR-associated exonuclease Cas4
MAQWYLEVTDLKQYTYCPRIVFYRYCLLDIRPLTVLMEEGILQHEQEESREDRRSLRHYGLKEGERSFHTVIRSEALGLVGSMDLIIVTPTRTAPDAQAIVVEYKYSEQKAGPHFKLQLAAYALLIEEAWQLPVTQGYIYSIPLKKAEPIKITPHLKKQVIQTIQSIQQLVTNEIMPPPPLKQHRCLSCEFRRFCNDVV